MPSKRLIIPEVVAIANKLQSRTQTVQPATIRMQARTRSDQVLLRRAIATGKLIPVNKDVDAMIDNFMSKRKQTTKKLLKNKTEIDVDKTAKFKFLCEGDANGS